MPYVLRSQLSDISFSLEIVGYEKPEETSDRYDSNWILIRISGQKGLQKWNNTHAALLTWEIEDLIRWCRGGFDLEPLLQFVDQSIEFFAQTVDPETTHLKITLSGKLLPVWHNSNSLTLDLFVYPDDLRKFSMELDGELSKFPYRETRGPLNHAD